LLMTANMEPPDDRGNSFALFGKYFTSNLLLLHVLFVFRRPYLNLFLDKRVFEVKIKQTVGTKDITQH
jgi:hypothetical protein